jgi:predicted P-loop ATPase
VQTVPRRCVFIGTTNNPQFLTDKTGNRRFYPVTVHSDGYALLDNEKIVREYIRQAWAEAVHLYKEGNLQPFAKREVLELIRAAQESAMEDDWRTGAIEQYLEDMKREPNATVSVIELWHLALNEPDESKPTRADAIAITQIITNVPGWVKTNTTIRTRWGTQKVFRKTNPFFPVWRG